MIAAAVSLVALALGGAPTTKLTDGDYVQLVARIASRSHVAQRVFFQLEGSIRIGSCVVAPERNRCSTASFPTLGWRWAGDHRTELRTLTASLEGSHASARLSLRVLPRPVVLVHGLLSTAGVWHEYLGPSGYLARLGLSGFAVGDGQVAGNLDMGALLAPTHQTNTIAQNAAVLATYIAGVKRRTGAQMVDVVAHSMGGLVTRYYVARLMKNRDVAEVVMLGTPNGGSDCSALPAALGFYVPATLELRPSYVSDVFNREVTARRGVSFFAIAGTKIINSLTAACTGVPSDLVVSLSSVSATESPVGKPAVLHTELEHDPDVFQRDVTPLLERAPNGFPTSPAGSRAARRPPELISFGRVASGHIRAGGRAIVPVSIDAGVTLAGFALYDRSRSLDVIVRGASGSIVHLDADHTGLVVVSDPTSLVTLGYGVNNPRPGPWLITLRATSRTPKDGADFALAARLVGGAQIETTIAPASARAGAPVAIAVRVVDQGQTLDTLDVSIGIRAQNGVLLRITAQRAAGIYRARWRPATPGLYGVDVNATGTTEDGAPLERSAFRTVDVRP